MNTINSLDITIVKTIISAHEGPSPSLCCSFGHVKYLKVLLAEVESLDAHNRRLSIEYDKATRETGKAIARANDLKRDRDKLKARLNSIKKMEA